MLIHYFECLAAEIKSFFRYVVCWIVLYALANYCGLRGGLCLNLKIFLPFMCVYILFNAYMRFVDECEECDSLD